MMKSLNREKIKKYKILASLFLKPFFNKWFLCIITVFSALAMTLSQGLLLLISGPIMRLLLTVSPDRLDIPLDELMPSLHLENYVEGWSYSFSYGEISLGILFIMMFLVLVRGFSFFFFLVSQQRLILYMVTIFREKLFLAVLKQDYEDFTKHNAAYWASRIVSDTEFLQQRFLGLGKNLFRNLLGVIGALFVLLILSWQATLIIILFIVPVTFFIGTLTQKLAGYIEAAQESLAMISSHILHIRERFSYIYSQNAQKAETKIIEKELEKHHRSLRLVIPIRSLMPPMIEFLGLLVFVGFLWFYFRDPQFLSPDRIIPFFLAIASILKPVRSIASEFSQLRELSGALKKSLEFFLTYQVSVKTEAASRRRKSSKLFSIKINNISVKNKENNKNIINIKNLNIEPGKIIAITGPSGSGKSTFLRCLAGLIRPETWEANIPWQELHSMIAFVSQVPFFFQGSIRTNLQYGLQNSISDHEVFQLTEQLNLQELIKVPEDFENPFDPLHHTFSAGQLQRLVIIKALLSKKPIYLFDEPTSALDQDNEQRVLQLILDKVRYERHSGFYITHREESLASFDEVLTIS